MSADVFFTQYWSWLQATLASYIDTQVGIVAGALAPAIITLATIYVMAWGYLQLTGNIEEPILDGFRRIVTIGVILGISLHLWLYASLIVATFFQGPFDLAAAMVGAPPLAMIDRIWTRGMEIGDLFFAKAGVLNGNFGLYIAWVVVLLVTGLLCIYAMFLLALARIALAVLLALGPFFIAMLFFDSTKRFFEAWVAQLANYGFVAILTGCLAALLLALVDNFAAQTLAFGAEIQIVEAVGFLVTSVLAFLLLRQVMPMSAGLAGGVALATTNVVSRGIAWGMGSVQTIGRGMWDAGTGAGTTRYDPLVRKSGYWAIEAPKRAGTALWRRIGRPTNTIKRRA